MLAQGIDLIGERERYRPGVRQLFESVKPLPVVGHPRRVELLPQFEMTTVVLGVVAIAHSRVETVEEIADRLSEARRYLPDDRLVAAPDCGLGFLGRDLALRKLAAMTSAVERLE